jgi:hypothetical protein
VPLHFSPLLLKEGLALDGGDGFCITVTVHFSPLRRRRGGEERSDEGGYPLVLAAVEQAETPPPPVGYSPIASRRGRKEARNRPLS